MSQTSKLALLGGLTLVIVFAMFAFVAPIPQPLAYHTFADPRGVWGVPNFGDVMSNAVFVPVGLFGLWVIVKSNVQGPWWRDARLALAVFFVGVVLVGPGSAYYHWAPDNATLFWDRLPISVAFMGLLSAVIMDRIGARWSLPLLIGIGVCSAVYWHLTDDLRAYVLVQFLPVLIIPLMMWLWPYGKWIGWRAILWALIFYGLAKLTEHFDAEVFTLLGGVVSGHSIKHLFAAAGPLAVALTLKNQS